MDSDIKKLTKYFNDKIFYGPKLKEENVYNDFKYSTFKIIKTEFENTNYSNLKKTLKQLNDNFDVVLKLYKKKVVSSKNDFGNFEKLTMTVFCKLIIEIVNDIRKELKENEDFDIKKYLNDNIELLSKGTSNNSIVNVKVLDLDNKNNTKKDDETEYEDETDDDETDEDEFIPDEEESEESEESDDTEYDEDDDNETEELFEPVILGKRRRKTNYEKEKKQKTDKHIDRQFTEIYDDLFDGDSSEDRVLNHFKKFKDEEKINNVEKLRKLLDIENEEPILFKIINLDIPLEQKHNILSEYISLEKSTYEKSKLKTWLKNVLKLPFGQYRGIDLENLEKDNIKEFLDKLKNNMDEAVLGHNEAKNRIVEVMGQYITNPNSKGTCIGIYGPPGNGKTTMIKEGIAKAMDRPFVFISLGGAQDATFLEGHSYTYEGSIYGRIAQGLMDSKCMNPIFYFDELDKVSDTHRGREIINLLVHLIDPAQNMEFVDKYFYNLKLDISKATFIFSYNRRHNIDRILRDRITEIQTKTLLKKQKISITLRYLMKGIYKDVGLEDNTFIIPDDIIEHIISNYTFEGGVRKLKSIIYSMIRQLNILNLTEGNIHNKLVTNGYMVSMDDLDVLLRDYQSISLDKIHKYPKVGVINGMWANDLGVGGVLPIESSWIRSEKAGTIKMTGSLQDVIKESIIVAETVAWNSLKKKEKKNLEKRYNEISEGIHIHCPDGSTPKDGPSAGTAMTVVLYSMYTGKKIKNSIAITGEINLRGEVTKIGGLEEKLHGAKKAGVRLALIPEENMDDLEKIKERDNKLLDRSFEVRSVNNIRDVLKIVFV